MMRERWPLELRFERGARRMVVRFDDTSEGAIAYKVLRENSPSAEVQGHGRGPKPPQAPVPDDIDVVRAEPVGRYAVRIVFSDGHATGLYTWRLLGELALGLNTAAEV